MSENKKNGLTELIRFAITGGVCFLLEYVVLVLLVDGTGMDTMLATPIAFLVSVILNYLLCLRWVFHAGKQGNAAKAGFLITSLLGLVLNELMMLIFRTLFGEELVLLTLGSFAIRMYMVNKVLATLIVMVWNYFTKRAVMRSSWLARMTARK